MSAFLLLIIAIIFFLIIFPIIFFLGLTFFFLMLIFFSFLFLLLGYDGTFVFNSNNLTIYEIIFFLFLLLLSATFFYFVSMIIFAALGFFTVKIKKITGIDPSDDMTLKKSSLRDFAKIFFTELNEVLKKNRWIFSFILPSAIIIFFLFNNKLNQTYQWV